MLLLDAVAKQQSLTLNDTIDFMWARTNNEQGLSSNYPKTTFNTIYVK